MVCYWAVIALVTHVLAIAAFSLKRITCKELRK